MKKLLILMLVLGLTSAANAALITFDASAEPACTHSYDRDVMPGDIVVVEITSDTAVTSSYLVSITESTTSAAGNSTATAGSYHASFDYQVNTGNVQNKMTDSGAGTPRYMLIDRASAGMSPAGNIAAGQVLYSFSTTIPSGAVFCDTFTITAAVGTPVITIPPAIPYAHQADSVNIAGTTALTIHVIPEPMTIALLGLGGLLLRRRKGGRK